MPCYDTQPPSAAYEQHLEQSLGSLRRQNLALVKQLHRFTVLGNVTCELAKVIRSHNLMNVLSPDALEWVEAHEERDRQIEESQKAAETHKVKFRLKPRKEATDLKVTQEQLGNISGLLKLLDEHGVPSKGRVAWIYDIGLVDLDTMTLKEEANDEES